MQVNTSELTGAALDWAVAKAANIEIDEDGPIWFGDHQPYYEAKRMPFSPSTDWSQGGPIIEREKIITSFDRGYDFDQPWRCALSIDPYKLHEGPTPLIAAMRCYVASKLGDTVDVPQELVCE